MDSEGICSLMLSRNSYRLSFIVTYTELVIIIIMKVTSLNLSSAYKRKSSELEIQQPLNIRDSGQPKIKKVENTFTIKSHMVADRDRQTPNKRHSHSNPRPKRFATSHELSTPQRPRELEKSVPIKELKQSLHQPKQDKQEGSFHSRKVSFCLKFRNDGGKIAFERGRKPGSCWSEDRNMVKGYLINDEISSDMLKLKRKRKQLNRHNKSEATFLSQYKNCSVLCRNNQSEAFSYFDRQAIVSYKPCLNSPRATDLTASLYEDKMEKEVLQSQRSVLLRSIKDEVVHQRQPMSNERLSELLEAAKSKQLSKVINERKRQLKTSLIQRRFSPYYIYMTMSKQQKAHFKKQHELHQKSLKIDALLEDIDVRISKV